VASRYRRKLEEIADAMLDPEVSVGSKSAATAVAALNAALRSLVIEADLTARGELESRLKALEERLKWTG
jgi:formiminotetrahydrofolate cyclodeaminase